MQVSELNIIGEKIFSEADSIRHIIKESISTPVGTQGIATNFRASARRMRIESHPAQSRIESQIAFNMDLPLNAENANRALQYLDQMIAEYSGKHPDVVVSVYTYEKLALHMYLGNTDEAVDCLSKLQELEGIESDDDEEGECIEGETAHALLGWAAGGGVAEVMELATFSDPLILLLLKAKGISLPKPYFSVEDSFITDFTGDKEIDEKLFSRNYQEALTLLEIQLKNNKLSELDRENFLQARGLCKAMMGDYEGALQDYNDVIDSDPNFNIEEPRLIRGLIHFLNDDPEKARIDIWLPPKKDEMTLQEYFWKKFSIEDHFSGFAIAKILDL